VFAKSEFDLGKFNTIQHGNDTGTNRPCNVRGINISPLVVAFTIYSPAIDSVSCAPTLMTELGGTLHPLTRNTPVSFSLTKGFPVPKLMGITSHAMGTAE
jgi:hypothetical protein